MAVGSSDLPTIHSVPGIRLGAVSAGIKTPGRLDVVLIEMVESATLTAAFTQNAFCAAPVTVAKQNLQDSNGAPGYLLVNTGNANAGTGEQGIADAQACCSAVAELTDAGGLADYTVLQVNIGFRLVGHDSKQPGF